MFRIFADDTNIFYSSRKLSDLEYVVNEELLNVIKYCAVNKLSINFKKTNYMLVTSPKKNLNISITSCDIEYKTQIKYLGVFIDSHLQWGMQISHVNNKLAKNIGIIKKLRYYVSLSTLKHLYYTLIYPYLCYGLTSWGTATQSRLKLIESKQNECIRSIFFAKRIESASSFYKLLEILKLGNIFKLKISILIRKSKCTKLNVPDILHELIPSASNIHKYNTRYATKDNIFRPASRTNYGLSRFKSVASRLWEEVPAKIKSLSYTEFKKQFKSLLLDHQA